MSLDPTREQPMEIILNLDTRSKTLTQTPTVWEISRIEDGRRNEE